MKYDSPVSSELLGQDLRNFASPNNQGVSERICLHHGRKRVCSHNVANPERGRACDHTTTATGLTVHLIPARVAESLTVRETLIRH